MSKKKASQYHRNEYFGFVRQQTVKEIIFFPKKVVSGKTCFFDADDGTN